MPIIACPLSTMMWVAVLRNNSRLSYI